MGNGALYMEDEEKKKALIDIWSAMFKCSCGHIFRISFTEGFKTFVPRKCEKCGRLNKEGYIEVYK